MFMRSKTRKDRVTAGMLSAMFVCALALAAQELPVDPRNGVKINLPPDSPVALLSATVGESRASARGAAVVLDLHMVLTLRNATQSRIHGVTLRVVWQDLTLGGKASVTAPSLNVGPGETFPIRVDEQLMRPSRAGAGPVQVDLDGVLFQDLSFYGPDRLNSRRAMTAWDMEAQRDREHLKRALAQGGREGLRREMLDSLERQAERPRLDVRVLRGGRAISAAALAPERTAEFAFLNFPGSPVEPVNGWAQVAGNEARAPRIELRNISSKPVKYVELGWLVRDQSGQQYMAASIEPSGPDLFLPPGKTGRVLQEAALEFSRGSGPVDVQGMTGFISKVEFADGKMWVPSRRNLEDAQLVKIVPPSAEEQRLSELYRRKGIDALIQELNKF
jgi:hypothetical protein